VAQRRRGLGICLGELQLVDSEQARQPDLDQCAGTVPGARLVRRVDEVVEGTEGEPGMQHELRLGEGQTCWHAAPGATDPPAEADPAAELEGLRPHPAA
jgi:hypothetical protein